jgi:hypothetical protein
LSTRARTESVVLARGPCQLMRETESASRGAATDPGFERLAPPPRG